MNFSKFKIEQFMPGTYSVLQLTNLVNSTWESIKNNIPYFIPTFSYTLSNDKLAVHSINIYNTVSHYLNTAVIKRCLATERPIACLLSGGLDSSLVTALANNFVKQHNLDSKLETYSIGLAGSEDLKFARIVAEYLGTNHTEIIVTEKDMFDAIPEVIYAIESYDTTTVRASIGNYLLGKYIAKHSSAKVILNGDGADELCGGYLYMNKCPDNIEFDKETRRLLKDIHLFDVLRSDKSISSHGLEPRTPFLDKTFVNNYLSIPAFFRNHNNAQHIEKHVLRTSFSIENFKDFEGTQLLPDEVLWRRKEAFSDGVTSKGRSLYQILQQYITFHLNIEISDVKLRYFANIDTEKYYYKKLFMEFFPNCETIIPYYWMPKYVSATDPSARTLDIYVSTEKKEL
jgi:asparagine synthase (glutamine-hydrolysing)